MLKETKTFNTRGGTKNISENYLYDSDKRLVKKIEYFLGNLSKVTLYENGLEIMQTRYNETGNVFDIAKNEYDNRGNLLLVTVTYSDGTLKEKFGYTYDVHGFKKMIKY